MWPFWATFPDFIWQLCQQRGAAAAAAPGKLTDIRKEEESPLFFVSPVKVSSIVPKMSLESKIDVVQIDGLVRSL